METVLVIGSDTDAGAHLARHNAISGRTRAVTIGSAGAEACCSLDVARARLVEDGITRVVYCGQSSQSAWFIPEDARDDSCELDDWAEACHQRGIPMTLLSSDAVFTGPWMFHAEDDQNFCGSPAAARILRQEARLRAIHPGALVIRTHLFGWGQGGWLNRFEHFDGEREPESLDCVPHATPLYAGLLPPLLDEIHAAGVTGILHVAGSERIDQYALGCRLARSLETSEPTCRSTGTLTERPTGFARGETSLQTARVRKILGRGLPTIQDSLDAAVLDRDNGVAASLNEAGKGVLAHVA